MVCFYFCFSRLIVLQMLESRESKKTNCSFTLLFSTVNPRQDDSVRHFWPRLSGIKYELEGDYEGLGSAILGLTH